MTVCPVVPPEKLNTPCPPVFITLKISATLNPPPIVVVANTPRLPALTPLLKVVVALVEKVFVSDNKVVEAFEPEPPPVIQLPLIEKHPPVRLIPLAKVDEAVALVALKMLALIPPVNVLVAVVVALKNPPVKKLALNSLAEGTFSIPFNRFG